MLVVATHKVVGSRLQRSLLNWLVEVLALRTTADPLRITAVASSWSSAPRRPPVRLLLVPRTATYPLRVVAVLSSSPSTPHRSSPNVETSLVYIRTVVVHGVVTTAPVVACRAGSLWTSLSATTAYPRRVIAVALSPSSAPLVGELVLHQASRFLICMLVIIVHRAVAAALDTGCRTGSSSTSLLTQRLTPCGSPPQRCRLLPHLVQLVCRLLVPRTAIYPLRVVAVMSSSSSAPRHAAGSQFWHTGAVET